MIQCRSAEEIKFWKSYDVECWYQHCSNVTFPTFFIPLTIDQITQLYEFMTDKKTMSEFKRRISIKMDSFDDLKDLFTCCISTVKYILQELENYFSTHPSSSGVFLRTSSNSPKDSIESFNLGRNRDYMVNTLGNQLSTIEEYINFLNNFQKHSHTENELDQFYNNQNEIFKIIRKSYTNLMRISENNLM